LREGKREVIQLPQISARKYFSDYKHKGEPKPKKPGYLAKVRWGLEFRKAKAAGSCGLEAMQKRAPEICNRILLSLC